MPAPRRPCARPPVAVGWVGSGVENANSGNRDACRRGEWMRDPTSSGCSGRARSDGGHVQGADFGLHGPAGEQSGGRPNRSVGLQLWRRNGDCQRVSFGSPQRDSENGIKLPLERRRTLTLIVARQLKRKPHHSEQWKLCRRRLPPGLLAIARLDRTNKAIKDYVVMPAPKIRGAYLWLSDASLARRNAVRLENSDGLGCAVQSSMCTKLRR